MAACPDYRDHVGRALDARLGAEGWTASLVRRKCCQSRVVASVDETVTICHRCCRGLQERVERIRGDVVRPDAPHQLHRAQAAAKVLELLGRNFATADFVEDDDIDLVRMLARGSL